MFRRNWFVNLYQRNKSKPLMDKIMSNTRVPTIPTVPQYVPSKRGFARRDPPSVRFRRVRFDGRFTDTLVISSSATTSWVDAPAFSAATPPSLDGTDICTRPYVTFQSRFDLLRPLCPHRSCQKRPRRTHPAPMACKSSLPPSLPHLYGPSHATADLTHHHIITSQRCHARHMTTSILYTCGVLVLL